MKCEKCESLRWNRHSTYILSPSLSPSHSLTLTYIVAVNELLIADYVKYQLLPVNDYDDIDRAKQLIDEGEGQVHPHCHPPFPLTPSLTPSLPFHLN